MTWPTLAIDIATTLSALVISVGLAQNAVYLLQLIIAAVAFKLEPAETHPQVMWRCSSSSIPPVSVLAPAYNEEATVVASAKSLLGLSYAAFEVILINDGSTDGTFAALEQAFDLQLQPRDHDAPLQHLPVRGVYGSAGHPNLTVIDKENGGKADALNAGVNFARNPLICAIDADSILEADALVRAVQPFVESPDEVVATGGTVRVANGCRIRDGRVEHVGLPSNPLALFQTVEYLRAFLMARLAWSRLGVLTIISGAFGVFRRNAVIEIGGYARGTVGEDLELVVRLHRYCREHAKSYRIAFVPEPVCWTQAPETLVSLSRQRTRWERGALETFASHRAMLMNPRYGRIGVLGFAIMFLADVLGPAADLLGYALIPPLYLLGLLSLNHVLAFLAVNVTFGVAISVASLALEEVSLRRVERTRDLLLLTLAAILENFGYRQLNSFWRVQGFWQWLRGAQQWGEMVRQPFSAAEPALRGGRA